MTTKWIRVKSFEELTREGLHPSDVYWCSPQMDFMYGRTFKYDPAIYGEPLTCWSLDSDSASISDMHNCSWIVQRRGFYEYDFDPGSLVYSPTFSSLQDSSMNKMNKGDIRSMVKEAVLEAIGKKQETIDCGNDIDANVKSYPYEPHPDSVQIVYDPNWGDASKDKKEHKLEKLTETPIPLVVIDKDPVILKKLPSGRKEKPIVLTNIE